MAESAAFARRGTKGGAARTALSVDVSDAATTISCVSLSTWTGATTNGPATATIARGAADEEIIEFTGISSNDLTGVTRGVGGTTAVSHLANATIEMTSQVRDFDEANRLVNAIFGISSLAAGDLLYLLTATTFARLAKGTARQQLAMNSGATAPEWVASLQSLLTAQGDTVYASSANTPARLAKGTAGQVFRMNSGATAPEWATIAGAELGYAEVTANQTGVGTSATDLTSLTTTVTVGSKAIIVEGWARVQKKTAGGYSVLDIYDSTGTAIVQQDVLTLTTDGFGSLYARVRLAPAAGSRTYKLQLSAENNTVDMIASSTSKAFIRVSEV